MDTPDPHHMVSYCTEGLPRILTSARGVESGLAQQIGEDILVRAEAFATLTPREQKALAAPFVEEVFDHRPADVSLQAKANVTVVVRNSLLEQAHHNGQLRSGIPAITEDAAGPLSRFLAARRFEPVGYDGPNPFAGLTQYPRASACLHSLTKALAAGGRQALKLPAAAVPALPADDEIAEAAASSHDANIRMFSAIDPRFDHDLVDQLRQAAAGNMTLCVSALSRYSRNSTKLHRIVEYLLAHNASILTTNYLIKPTEVWVRPGALIKPNSYDPYSGIAQTRGLTGAHRYLVEAVHAQLR